MLTFACGSQKIVLSPSQTVADNKYDSEFPTSSIAKELSFISSTVKKLDCLVFYMSSTFPAGNNINRQNINDSVVKFSSVANEVTNESVAGTTTVIYNDSKMVGLLTCDHVIDFTDSLFTFYPDEIGGLKTLSVKIKQQIFIAGLPLSEQVEIVITDPKKDLALLKVKLEPDSEKLNVLNFPVGNTNDLEWGSLVYVMGFPLGNIMVINAIVSNPEHSSNGTFLTNALFNRGISGSPVFAIRDGVPNFELVGIASSASAQTVNYLIPEKADEFYTNPDGSYDGKIFIDQKKDINYGVTYTVAIEEVTGFLRKNRNLLEKEGFDFEKFFKSN